MLVHLDKIADEPYCWNVDLSIAAEALDRPDLTDLSEVNWKGEIGRDSPGYRLKGQLAYRQAVACSRCLAPIVQPVETELELILLVGEPEPSVGEVELTETDLDTVYLEDERLDMEPILMEQLQLNLPMRLLCREDCAGICPSCGVNRNQETCDCEGDSIDPRWAALEDWPGN